MLEHKLSSYQEMPSALSLSLCAWYTNLVAIQDVIQSLFFLIPEWNKMISLTYLHPYSIKYGNTCTTMDLPLTIPLVVACTTPYEGVHISCNIPSKGKQGSNQTPMKILLHIIVNLIKTNEHETNT